MEPGERAAEVVRVAVAEFGGRFLDRRPGGEPRAGPFHAAAEGERAGADAGVTAEEFFQRRGRHAKVLAKSRHRLEFGGMVIEESYGQIEPRGGVGAAGAAGGAKQEDVEVEPGAPEDPGDVTHSAWSRASDRSAGGSSRIARHVPAAG